MQISRKAFQNINTDQNQNISKVELQTFVQKHNTDGDGKFGYIQDLKSELPTSQFRNVRKWMQDADAGASITLQSYARSIGS